MAHECPGDAAREVRALSWRYRSIPVSGVARRRRCPEMDRARGRGRLPLAAGERSNRLAGVADIDADIGHRLLGDGVCLVLVEPREGEYPAHRLATKKEVSRDAHQRNHAEILED